ncbi:hypothetical protein CVT25_015800 [Psilocybe cyanescens]|uniref:SET domain-containing protein n=1 Tax=Psilocybe cyanescens TaxID=93625 RepID=A0A409X1K3_PSICY|nr:hypothetical protein CVT25_015800 [Psilocybe cyanescens]
MPSPEIQSFLSWFQSHGGYIDTSAMDVVDFPASEGGRGAIALVDIPENHVVFSVPRLLLLTPRTSALPARMGVQAWRRYGLHKGWAGLILCMMWEAARGAESKWCPYFEMMPTRFDTPMFWSEDDLAELKGTSVVDKLGKEEAEKDYTDKVLPAIHSRPDLFAKEDIPTRYSIAVFHMMGTRISSRSFTLSKDDEEGEEEEDKEPGHVPAAEGQDVGNASMGSAMDVDEPAVPIPPQQQQTHAHDHENYEEDHDHDHAHGEGGEGDEDEDDEEDDTSEVAMVPLADILNARYKSENVRLFYEPDSLKMVSTRIIKAGEQIWNTYGDPPNGELLRGYGHVDYVSLPYAPGEYGNPGDVVELRADLVVQCVLDEVNGQREGEGARGKEKKLTMEDVEERIDWWLDEGGEDIFVIEHPYASLTEFASTPSSSNPNPNPDPNTDPKALLASSISPVLLAFIRLIQLTDAEWARARAKGKPPKPAVDARALRVVKEALGRRAGAYATSLDEDRRMIDGADDDDGMSLNKRHALAVRMGEKRVLEALGRGVEEALVWIEKEEMEAEAEKHKKELEDSGKKKREPPTMSRAEKRKAAKDGEDDGRKRRR